MHERNILYIPLGAGILHFQILQMHFLAFFSGKQKIQKVQHSYLSCRKILKGDSNFLLLFYGRHFSFSSYERNKSKKVLLGHFSRYCWTACYTLCFVYWPTYNALISSIDKYFSLAGLSTRVQSDAGTSKERGREPKRVANGELKIIHIMIMSLFYMKFHFSYVQCMSCIFPHTCYRWTLTWEYRTLWLVRGTGWSREVLKRQPPFWVPKILRRHFWVPRILRRHLWVPRLPPMSPQPPPQGTLCLTAGQTWRQTSEETTSRSDYFIM